MKSDILITQAFIMFLDKQLIYMLARNYTQFLFAKDYNLYNDSSMHSLMLLLLSKLGTIFSHTMSGLVFAKMSYDVSKNFHRKLTQGAVSYTHLTLPTNREV